LAREAPIRLGGFARYWRVNLVLIALGRITLALVGARVMGKGKIWGVRPLQTLPFSPSAEKRKHRAKDEYQHAKRYQEP
jgi:hypothetical protein